MCQKKKEKQNNKEKKLQKDKILVKFTLFVFQHLQTEFAKNLNRKKLNTSIECYRNSFAHEI